MPPNVENLIALPPGYRLGEYRIERYLGSGGFGITYSAIDENLNHRVAIKEYLPKSLAMRDANDRVTVATAEDEADFRWGLDRFLDEARALAHFDHPNIVGVKRFIEAHGTGYIVMEFVDGEPLSERLKRKPTLTEAEIREHVLPLAAGLAEIHAAGLLHRDIKPSNIVVRADGVPVLIDFGSARVAVGARSQSLTAVVTPGYAPLEQYSSSIGDQGPTTDIYALGAVLYRCVTGKTPWDATERALEDPLTPVAEAADGAYREGLLTAIDAALAIRADERPRDIAAFLQLVSARDNGREQLEDAGANSGGTGRGVGFGSGDGLAGKESRDSARVGSRCRTPKGARWAIVPTTVIGAFVVVAILLAAHQGGETRPMSMRSGPRAFLQAYFSVYRDRLGVDLDFDTFVNNVLSQDVQLIEDMAEFMYNDRYASQDVPREEFEERAGIKAWRDDQPTWVEGAFRDIGAGMLTWLAALGQIEAQFRLGVIYYELQDDAQAVKWFSRAAEQGHADAQLQLARMYANGEGVPADNVQAYAWANLASVDGLPDAVTFRDGTAQRLSAAQLAEAQQLSSELEARIRNTR